MAWRSCERGGARHNDAVIGRWHCIDKEAEKYYGISPYAYCGGDPVNFGDYDGMDTLYFKMNEDGKTASFDEKRSSDGEHVGIIKDGEGNTLHQFSFIYQKDADCFIREKDATKTSQLIGVCLVDKETIKNQIESVPGWLGSLPYQYRFLSLAYALTQSRGSDRTLDFVNYPFIQERPGYLFIPDDSKKIAHDSFNFGNYLWGAGMRRLGIPLSVSLIGGNIDNLMHHKLQFDSADDMASISLGYMFCPQPSLFRNHFGL